MIGLSMADNETMREAFNKTLVSMHEGCSKVTDAKIKCKGVDYSKSHCNSDKLLDSLFMKIYSTWEQNEQCKSIDYYGRAASHLEKISGWVFNITTNWTSYFDSKSNLILKNGKGTFICQFAAKRYFQLKDPNFFHNDWRPAAIKCSNFLANVRRGLMCAVCDPNDQKYFSTIEENGKNKSGILFDFRMCNEFVDSCLDYIQKKAMFLDKLNVAFTLALCDKEGQYLAQNTKSYYKKVLPSEVVYEEEDIEFCRGHIKKDLSSTQAERERNEKSCFRLCHKYFGQAAMIADDLNTFDNFQYMHDILKEIVNDNFHQNLFIARTGPASQILLDFKEMKYSFYPSSESKGLNLERHMKDNNYKEFDSSKYLRKSFLPEFLALLTSITILLLY